MKLDVNILNALADSDSSLSGLSEKDKGLTAKFVI